MTVAVVETKRCPRCKSMKPVADFYRNRSQKDGLQNYCKPCNTILNKSFAETPAGRASLIRRVRRYEKTENGKAMIKRIDAARKDTPQVKARARVRDLVHKGKIPSAKTLPCFLCKGKASQYHHHLGYEREHREQVLPVCYACHKSLHSK